VAAGPQVATPEGQCLGRHVLEYALRFDADQLDDLALLRESQDYRSDFLIMAPGVEFEPPPGLADQVVFSCLRGAENGDGRVMRIFNPRREATVARSPRAGDARGVNARRIAAVAAPGCRGRGRAGRDRDVAAAERPSKRRGVRAPPR
jgi:hypothetical protein